MTTKELYKSFMDYRLGGKSLPFRNPPKVTKAKKKTKKPAGTVLWVSCQIISDQYRSFKKQVGGQYVRAAHGPLGQTGDRRVMIEQRRLRRGGEVRK
jgi:hypothetical protein